MLVRYALLVLYGEYEINSPATEYVDGSKVRRWWMNYMTLITRYMNTAYFHMREEARLASQSLLRLLMP
jgi:hypothetical protein